VQNEIKQISAMLSATQIAVFPVDSRGLLTTNPGAEVTGEELRRDPSQRYSANVLAEITNAYQTMSQFAEQTGGVVFHNTNNITDALRRGAELGGNYYTLSYRPPKADWNGNYRKITVRARREGLKLHYRPGYFAIEDPFHLNGDKVQALNAAMSPLAPVSTALVMKVRITPPSNSTQKTAIEILLDPHDLAWADADAEHKTATVRYDAVAFDAAGKNVASFQGDFSPKFDHEHFAEIMKRGMQVHELLAVKPGSFTLRIGVMDRNTGRMGTLDVPLEVPSGPSNGTAKSN
jgi:hypothetical protein